jgi:hypothetical protein
MTLSRASGVFDGVERLGDFIAFLIGDEKVGAISCRSELRGESGSSPEVCGGEGGSLRRGPTTRTIGEGRFGA